MTDTRRMKRYLSAHAECARSESRLAFKAHLILYAVTLGLYGTYGFLWMRDIFLIWLTPLVAWGIALGFHYREGVRGFEAELDECITELTELFASRTPGAEKPSSWAAKAG